MKHRNGSFFVRNSGYKIVISLPVDGNGRLIGLEGARNRELDLR